MRITESQLRSIIKQELKKVFSLNELHLNPTPTIGQTVKYELSVQGEYGKGKIASIDEASKTFTLDPETVEFDFSDYGKGWVKQKNLRPDELTHSIDSIIKIY